MVILKSLKTEPAVAKAHNEYFYKNFYVSDTMPEMKKVGIDGDYFTVSYKAIYDHYFNKVVGEKDEAHNLESTDWNNICREITKPFLIEKHLKDGKEGTPVVDGYGIYINAKINGLPVLVGVKIAKSVQHGKTLSSTNKILTAFGRRNRKIQNICYIDWYRIPKELEKQIDWTTAENAIIVEKAQKKR